MMDIFKDDIRKNGDAVNAFCDALQNRDASSVTADGIWTKVKKKKIFQESIKLF